MHKTLTAASVLTLGLLAGCSGAPPAGDGSADALARDLKLANAPAPEVEVASRVELGLPEPPAPPVRRPRPTPKPAPAPALEPVAELEPVPEPAAVPAPAAVAVAEAPAPAPTGRELAPGQTVTVLPASSGPSTGGRELDYPEGQGLKAGGGGHCPLPPRRGGRPIGIIGFR